MVVELKRMVLVAMPWLVKLIAVGAILYSSVVTSIVFIWPMLSDDERPEWIDDYAVSAMTGVVGMLTAMIYLLQQKSPHASGRKLPNPVSLCKRVLRISLLTIKYIVKGVVSIMFVYSSVWTFIAIAFTFLSFAPAYWTKVLLQFVIPGLTACISMGYSFIRIWKSEAQ